MDLPILKAYVLSRDKYICQYCKGKVKTAD